MKTRVTLVEDNDELREWLAVMLNGSPGFACSGAHATAEQALKAIPFEKPDVLLLDLELPHMSGEEFIREAKARWPKLEILILTVHDEPKRIFAALEAGASGYLVKPAAPAKLLEALADVAAGGSPMSSQIARLVLSTFRERGKRKQDLGQLTPREEEILALLSQGHRYQEIADGLGLSLRTVGTHLHHIYAKLHVRSRTEAAAKYLQR
ncbi:MAG: response regulator transcription factor [Verrucomicrobia bacterium]|nr:response regulator transcription factor [Verrucomicrobiota bacterium]